MYWETEVNNSWLMLPVIMTTFSIIITFQVKKTFEFEQRSEKNNRR